MPEEFRSHATAGEPTVRLGRAGLIALGFGAIAATAACYGGPPRSDSFWDGSGLDRPSSDAGPVNVDRK